MTPPVSESLSKVTLGISVVVIMGVLALGTFLVSGWGESVYQGGPVEHFGQVEYVVGGGVEVNDDVAAGSEWLTLDSNHVLKNGISFKTDDSNELGILFEGGDLIRLFPNTEVIFDEVDLNSSPLVLKGRLVSGEVWVSTLQDVLDVELSAHRVSVAPQHASSFMRMNEGGVTVFSAHHPTRVSFLSEEVPPVVLNDYLLTESHEVTIQESFLDASLAELRYTKLTKEFPFKFVKASEWEAAWTLSLKADLDRLDEGLRLFLSNLKRERHEGASSGTLSYKVGEIYKQVRSWMTIDKSYLKEVERSDDLDVLYQALYLISENRDAEALERLNRFQALVSTFDSTDHVADLIRIFRAVEWGNEFYPVKNLLREIQLRSVLGEEKRMLELQFLRDRLNEVYDVSDLGERADAKEALEEYNREWLSFMNSSGSELVNLVQRLTEERQILQNLLYQEDSFYSLDSYAVLSSLEQRILNLTSQDFDLNEERLAFVQDKIRVLTHLVTLIENKRVNVKEGVALGNHLLAKSEALMASVTQQVAVTELFNNSLSELKQQFKFIGSPEYSLGAGSFKERLAEYLLKEKSLSELSTYVSGLSSEADSAVVSSEVGLDEALAEAEAALRAAHISFDSLSLIPRKDQDYRLFRIEGGYIGEVAFSANYDRLSQLVYDLSVEGEAFSSGVKLNNLVQVVTKALNEKTNYLGSVNETAETDLMSQPKLSPVEKLALELAVKNIERVTKLPLKADAVTIDSLEDDLFDVVMEVPTQVGQFKVSFVYDMDSGEAMDIVAVRDLVTFSVDSVAIEKLQVEVEAVAVQQKSKVADQP